ncbi:TIGR03364 family FAD-dependent oxidoreductase [Zobellia sp. 1_MG-2023]|uniref:TIGR03364 family FAD-dependent oxidoreductase n=1 Tax=Zobellia sp. 1_MG-2023 TaxID=3062626 RepID=UPI0026E35D8C|nr:TIGR03364 family FAD-dependent oxidoreductase [Zobellia sp. 1_MG-2023]MDO6818005.1 TIGR03364 family FAD-dependent oxidoreductase [Zobellia sp. 1_MG-2023]
MENKYDLIVVGGGVLGTFHAYHAVNKGLKVALLEKDAKPQGATVRNFGQVVPSGMDSKWQLYGRESLNIYKHIQSKFDISVRQEGSIYIASNEEETQLLLELNAINLANSYTSKLLTKEECLEMYPGLRADYVKMGLFFPEEVMVEPRLMIGKLQAYLEEVGMDVFMNKTVVECNALTNWVQVHTTDNTSLSAAKVIICNGSDFKTLYPSLFAESDLIVSKLQMMQTKHQPNYKLPSSILTGLSIRRYEAFSECPSYASIKAKENSEAFEKKWGVHILFKQATDGSVIIGDSHEYAPAARMDHLGMDLNMDIDNFILKEAKKIFDLPTYQIQNRWYGLYSQCKEEDIYQHTIDRNIHIVTGIGGKGMTGSSGFAKENINSIFNLQNA